MIKIERITYHDGDNITDTNISYKGVQFNITIRMSEKGIIISICYNNTCSIRYSNQNIYQLWLHFIKFQIIQDK